MVLHSASFQIFVFHPRVQWSSLTQKNIMVLQKTACLDFSDLGISLLLLLLLENAGKGNFA